MVTTYEGLVDVITDRLTDDATRQAWAGPVTGVGTINAFVRRMRSSVRPLRSLIRGDLGGASRKRVSTQDQQLTVVDLHNLQERAQRFVVGVVLAAETARKEAAGPGGLLFTMIDELNKYAPREGSSPIKEVLLDIAERGRSPRHHSHRRAADGERSRTAHRVQLGHPRGRPARPGRGRADRVRVPARAAADPGHAGQAGGHVRLAARDPGSARDRVPLPGLGHPAGRVRGTTAPAGRGRERTQPEG